MSTLNSRKEICFNSEITSYENTQHRAHVTLKIDKELMKSLNGNRENNFKFQDKDLKCG